MEKVVLGMSGGVDSALAALELKNAGYEVSGLYIDFHGFSEEGYRKASALAGRLRIGLERADARELMEKRVIQPFAQSYLKGMTPNPCVICNPLVKFKTLEEYAGRTGAGLIATGHYAVAENGRLYASPSQKDQSYMLYRLSRRTLSRCLFPLGEKPKEQVVEKALSLGLIEKSYKESMDICFMLGGTDMEGFLRSLGFEQPGGRFISPEGNVLGTHGGIGGYTVGQRRGLNVSSPLGRLYVTKIDPETGDITLSHKRPMAVRVYLEDIVFHEEIKDQSRLFVKLRHGKGLFEALWRREGFLELVTPAPFASPGQSAVCYNENGLVLMGGFIKSADFTEVL